MKFTAENQVHVKVFFSFLFFAEHEKLVVIVKEENDTDFGLHIYDSHPAVITDVDSGKSYGPRKEW